MAKLIFTCPKCGEHNVEEVITCNQASFLITYADTDDRVEYADAQLDDDAMLNHYCCADCGHILKDVIDLDDLKKKYMKEI